MFVLQYFSSLHHPLLDHVIIEQGQLARTGLGTNTSGFGKASAHAIGAESWVIPARSVSLRCPSFLETVRTFPEDQSLGGRGRESWAETGGAAPRPPLCSLVAIVDKN